MNITTMSGEVLPVEEANVKLAMAGDKEAFSMLINFYRQDLYRVSRGILKSDFDAADAIQEAIISAYSNIGSLKNEKYFKTWIIRILINECKKIIKNSKNIVSLDKVEEQSLSDKYPSDSDITNYINMLETDLRYATILYYYEDFSIKEISKILKVPQGTVKSRLMRARGKLLNLMSGKGE